LVTGARKGDALVFYYSGHGSQVLDVFSDSCHAGSMARDGVGTEVPELNHVLWAGCRDYQTSAEDQIGGAWRGIFTHRSCRVLRRADVGIPRARLGCPQVPRLKRNAGALAHKVFT
jgi:hypothetical protein